METAIAFAVLLGACSTWTHNDTLELRYTGVVAVTGGALLVVDPLLNGDHLSGGMTAIGSVLVALGVGAITGSYYADPYTPLTAAVCGDGRIK